MAVDSLTLRKERSPLLKLTINPGITSAEAVHTLHQWMTQVPFALSTWACGADSWWQGLITDACQGHVRSCKMTPQERAANCNDKPNQENISHANANFNIETC
eukprot:6112516-Amphidinium_carterae.1